MQSNRNGISTSIGYYIFARLSCKVLDDVSCGCYNYTLLHIITSSPLLLSQYSLLHPHNHKTAVAKPRDMVYHFVLSYPFFLFTPTQFPRHFSTPSTSFFFRLFCLDSFIGSFFRISKKLKYQKNLYSPLQKKFWLSPETSTVLHCLLSLTCVFLRFWYFPIFVFRNA